MTIKLLNENSIPIQTIGRVRGILVKSSGDLLITFDDFSEKEIKKDDYYSFYAMEY